MLSTKNIKMQPRGKTIVKRKVKDVVFIRKEECSVYKKQRKEKSSISCMQCNKDLKKKAAYLRRHMQKVHAYKTASLEQASDTSTKEQHEDLKEPESNKTDISDPGDVMDLIGSVASAADLSSGSNIRDTYEMCGFCPQTKTRVTPEFDSIWRDPFEIKKKASDVLYEIDYGKNGQTQTVHYIYIVDTMTNGL